MELAHQTDILDVLHEMLTVLSGGCLCIISVAASASAEAGSVEAGEQNYSTNFSGGIHSRHSQSGVRFQGRNKIVSCDHIESDKLFS